MRPVQFFYGVVGFSGVGFITVSGVSRFDRFSDRACGFFSGVFSQWFFWVGPRQSTAIFQRFSRNRGFRLFQCGFVTHDSTLRRNEMRSTTCGLRSARLGRRYACCDDASSNGVFARDFSHATMPTRRFHASALPPRVPPWRHYEDRRRTT